MCQNDEYISSFHPRKSSISRNQYSSSIIIFSSNGTSTNQSPAVVYSKIIDSCHFDCKEKSCSNALEFRARCLVIATGTGDSVDMTDSLNSIRYVPLFFISASLSDATGEADQYGRKRVLSISRIFCFPSSTSLSESSRGISGQAYKRSQISSRPKRGTSVVERSCSDFSHKISRLRLSPPLEMTVFFNLHSSFVLLISVEMTEIGSFKSSANRAFLPSCLNPTIFHSILSPWSECFLRESIPSIFRKITLDRDEFIEWKKCE